MVLVAVDPGLHGGVALLRADGSVLARPMPLAGKELDLIELARIIRDCGPQWLVLEKVGSRPGQGVAVPVELVTPQRWKGVVLHGTTKDKDAAISWCRRAFPDVALVPPGCRKPHDGMADALCLLEYGRRVLTSVGTAPREGATIELD